MFKSKFFYVFFISFLIFEFVNSQEISNLNININPDPDSIPLYGLFETVRFNLEVNLNDGSRDVNCNRFGVPIWQFSSGSIIKRENCTVYWNTGHVSEDTQVAVTVQYGGFLKSRNFVLRTGNRRELPLSYQCYAEETYMDELEKNVYSNIYMNPSNLDKKQKFIDAQNQKAVEFSDSLRSFILDWYYSGEKERVIPREMLYSNPIIDDSLSMNDKNIPDESNEIGIAIDTYKTSNWKLIRYEDIKPENQWYYYAALNETPDLYNTSKNSLRKNNAATHVTYLKLIYFAPIGTNLTIEGRFPYCRFMSFQASPPYDPEFIHYSNIGQMEVPIVDVDINPNPGSVNPFRQYSNRNSQNRDYKVTFRLEKGNMVELNPEVFRVINGNYYFRDFGQLNNTRVAGPFDASGPLGRGKIIPAVVWLRYYIPDKGYTPYELAGVELPKAYFELEGNNGEKIRFWIQGDLFNAKQRETKLVPPAETHLQKSIFSAIGPDFGWFKMFGILQVYAEGRSYISTYGMNPIIIRSIKSEIRKSLKVYESRGYDLSPPGNIPHSATDCPYVNYLVRNFQLEDGMVYVLVGKKPTTPRTINGNPFLEQAEARYWSISNTGTGLDGVYNGVNYYTLLDEDVVVDNDNKYYIVMSKKLDKPSNAIPQNGVTWMDAGPESNKTLVLRWMSIYPNHFSNYAPNDRNIPWESGAWSQENFNPSLISDNNFRGVIGEYQPKIYYMSKAQFEALGNNINESYFPIWIHNSKPLLISNSIKSNVDNNTLTLNVQWKVTKASRGRIEYSQNEDLSRKIVVSDVYWRTEPNITISNLDRNKVYYYQLISENEFGEYKSGIYTFNSSVSGPASFVIPRNIVTIQNLLNSYQKYRNKEISIISFLDLLKKFIFFR